MHYDPAKALIDKAWKAEIAVLQERCKVASINLCEAGKLVQQFVSDVPVSQSKITKLEAQLAAVLHLTIHILCPEHHCGDEGAFTSYLTKAEAAFTALRNSILEETEH